MLSSTASALSARGHWFDPWPCQTIWKCYKKWLYRPHLLYQYVPGLNSIRNEELRMINTVVRPCFAIDLIKLIIDP